MANLRETAQSVLFEARDGIAWIAVYKEGRGWGAACFWPDINRDGEFIFDLDDAEQIKEILAIDPNAVIVNPEYQNLGPTGEEGMTRDTLAKGMRWHYELQDSLLAEQWQEPAELEASTIKVGDRFYTPRFCTVTIDAVFTSEEDARMHGYRESTCYNGDCVILGKPEGLNRMVFAAVPVPQARSA